MRPGALLRSIPVVSTTLYAKAMIIQGLVVFSGLARSKWYDKGVAPFSIVKRRVVYEAALSGAKLAYKAKYSAPNWRLFARTSLLARAAKRNAECGEDRVAFQAVLRPELPVAAQVEVRRLAVELERVPDLGADGSDA